MCSTVAQCACAVAQCACAASDEPTADQCQLEVNFDKIAGWWHADWTRAAARAQQQQVIRAWNASLVVTTSDWLAFVLGQQKLSVSALTWRRAALPICYITVAAVPASPPFPTPADKAGQCKAGHLYDTTAGTLLAVLTTCQ
jgi:hypothetical protein